MHFLDLPCHSYNFAVKYKHNDSVYRSTISIQGHLDVEKLTPALQFDPCKEITALWEQKTDMTTVFSSCYLHPKMCHCCF